MRKNVGLFALIKENYALIMDSDKNPLQSIARRAKIPNHDLSFRHVDNDLLRCVRRLVLVRRTYPSAHPHRSWLGVDRYNFLTRIPRGGWRRNEPGEDTPSFNKMI